MKKLLALIMAVLMAATLFVGCGNTATEKATPDEVVVEEETFDENAKQICIRFEPFHDADYVYYEIKYIYDGEPIVENGLDVGHYYKEDETIEKYLERTGYTKFDIAREYDGFLGWKEYRMIRENSDVKYEPNSDALYTTEELLNMTTKDFDVAYVAMWQDTPESQYTELGY